MARISEKYNESESVKPGMRSSWADDDLSEMEFGDADELYEELNDAVDEFEMNEQKAKLENKKLRKFLNHGDQDVTAADNPRAVEFQARLKVASTKNPLVRQRKISRKWSVSRWAETAKMGPDGRVHKPGANAFLQVDPRDVRDIRELPARVQRALKRDSDPKGKAKEAQERRARQKLRLESHMSSRRPFVPIHQLFGTLIMILLVIGGVELNPGPYADRCSNSGTYLHGPCERCGFGGVDMFHTYGTKLNLKETVNFFFVLHALGLLKADARMLKTVSAQVELWSDNDWLDGDDVSVNGKTKSELRKMLHDAIPNMGLRKECVSYYQNKFSKNPKATSSSPPPLLAPAVPVFDSPVESLLEPKNVRSTPADKAKVTMCQKLDNLVGQSASSALLSVDKSAQDATKDRAKEVAEAKKDEEKKKDKEPVDLPPLDGPRVSPSDATQAVSSLLGIVGLWSMLLPVRCTSASTSRVACSPEDVRLITNSSVKVLNRDYIIQNFNIVYFNKVVFVSLLRRLLFLFLLVCFIAVLPNVEEMLCWAMKPRVVPVFVRDHSPYWIILGSCALLIMLMMFLVYVMYCTLRGLRAVSLLSILWRALCFIMLRIHWVMGICVVLTIPVLAYRLFLAIMVNINLHLMPILHYISEQFESDEVWYEKQMIIFHESEEYKRSMALPATINTIVTFVRVILALGMAIGIVVSYLSYLGERENFRLVKEITYCPHFAACVLAEYKSGTNSEVISETLHQKFLRLAKINVHDRHHMALIEGTSMMVYHLASEQNFTSNLILAREDRPPISIRYEVPFAKDMVLGESGLMNVVSRKPVVNYSMARICLLISASVLVLYSLVAYLTVTWVTMFLLCGIFPMLELLSTLYDLGSCVILMNQTSKN